VTVWVPGITSLAPGASTYGESSYAITQTDIDNGSFTNSAVVQGFYGGFPVHSNTGFCTVTAIQNTSLLLSINNPTFIDFPLNGRHDAGDQLQYTGKVTNNGNVTLHSVVLNCSKLGLVNYPLIGTLAPGASLIFP
jgi:hypothetical protein